MNVRRKVTRGMLEERLSRCLNMAIRKSCPGDPTIFFPGCPETTQLAWRTLDALGFGLEAVVMQGKAKEAGSDRWVDHVWVELPETGLRIETNAWQILGLPQFIEVEDISLSGDRYRDPFERMELLSMVTREGEKFYGSMARKVASCIQSRRRNR